MTTKNAPAKSGKTRAKNKPKKAAAKSGKTRAKNPPKKAKKTRRRRKKNPPLNSKAVKGLGIAALVGGGIALAAGLVRDAVDNPKADGPLSVGLPAAATVAGFLTGSTLIATAGAVLTGVAALNLAGGSLIKKGVTAAPALPAKEMGRRLGNPAVSLPLRDPNDMRGVLSYYGAR